MALNHAELPASPAAATNGRSGRQQLEAATAVASAAVLARIVPRPVWVLLLGTAMPSGFSDAPNGLANEGNAWCALPPTSGDICATAHTRITA